MTKTETKKLNVLFLNIGLKVGKDVPIEQNLRTAAQVYRLAHELDAAVEVLEETFGTEPTVVAALRMSNVETLSTLHDHLYLMSAALAQDCVSAARVEWTQDEEDTNANAFTLVQGALVGPKSEEWGGWDPNYMVLHNGINLGERLGKTDTLDSGRTVTYVDGRKKI
jgi:hypothetical protein